MKGIYVLLIEVEKNINIRIGNLRRINFRKGFYAYIGSAQNNLEKRIERHLKKEKKKFWHIDYLLSSSFAKVNIVFYKETDKEEECKIAKMLSKIAKQIKGFGSSDCNCESHLFILNDMKSFKLFLKREYFKRIIIS